MRPLRALCASLADDRGAAAVEFAILLLPMSICLLGMLDAGYSMYVKSDLQGALNGVARQATVETPTFAGTGTVAQQHHPLRKRLQRSRADQPEHHQHPVPRPQQLLGATPAAWNAKGAPASLPEPLFLRSRPQKVIDILP